MAYIGREPVTGNFVKLDSITVVNGQAAYTMNNGGSAFTAYDNVNQFLVSLNGVLQAPTDSFTVSGSTLTFASNLATGDVIDFVIVLGDTLDIGTPSDNTVTAAKIGANAVTSAKLNNDIISGATELATAPADTDEFLVSDAGTIKRIDYSLIKGGGNFIKLAGGDNITTDSNLYGYYTSDYINYRWIFNGVSSSSSSTLDLRLYKSSGAISSSGYSYAVGMNYRSSGSHQWTTSIADWQGSNFRLCSENVSSNGDLGATLIIDIFDPQSAQKKNVGWMLWHERHDGAVFAKDFGDGILDDTDAHTGINIFSTSGNFGAQHWALYGMKV
jgi:hypothetical protein